MFPLIWLVPVALIFPLIWGTCVRWVLDRVWPAQGRRQAPWLDADRESSASDFLDYQI